MNKKAKTWVRHSSPTKAIAHIKTFKAGALTLKDFPLVMTGCRAIQLDQYINGQEINGDATVRSWEVPMAVAEHYMQMLNGKTIGEFMPELLKMEFYTDLSADDNAVELIYMSVNDSAELILRKAGASETEIWVINMVFWSFFEGELRHRFEKIIPGSPADQLLKRMKRNEH